MRKQTTNRFPFFILIIGALVVMLALRSAQPSNEVSCEEAPPAKLQEASTQLLWESLSHQFVSSVQH